MQNYKSKFKNKKHLPLRTQRDNCDKNKKNTESTEKKTSNDSVSKEPKTDFISIDGGQMRIKKSLILFLFMFFVVIGGLNGEYIKQPDGITIKLKTEKATDAHLMKIEVCNENIFHITATSDKNFSTRPSLMVDKTDWETVPHSIKEEENEMPQKH